VKKNSRISRFSIYARDGAAPLMDNPAKTRSRKNKKRER
jgi:hypothetical protein